MGTKIVSLISKFQQRERNRRRRRFTGSFFVIISKRKYCFQRKPSVLKRVRQPSSNSCGVDFIMVQAEESRQ